MMKNRRRLLASRVITNADDPVGIPSVVTEALKVDFGTLITGYLCCAAFERNYAIGIIFGDLFGRFENGKGIDRKSVV